MLEKRIKNVKTPFLQYPGVMTEEELREARQKVGEKVDEDINMAFDKLEVRVCLLYV